MSSDENKVNQKKHWEFSFDLRQSRLRLAYGKPSVTHAYDELKNYFFKNGFHDVEQKQGSCYFTEEPLSFQEVDAIIKNMFEIFPWLSECIRKDALYEKPAYYSYSSYYSKINRTEKHFSDLKKYFKRIGREYSEEFAEEISHREADLVKRKPRMGVKLNAGRFHAIEANQKEKTKEVVSHDEQERK